MFAQAFVVLGQFLLLKKDTEMFTEWLKDASGANSRQAGSCAQCLQEWCDAFLWAPPPHLWPRLLTWAPATLCSSPARSLSALPAKTRAYNSLFKVSGGCWYWTELPDRCLFTCVISLFHWGKVYINKNFVWTVCFCFCGAFNRFLLSLNTKLQRRKTKIHLLLKRGFTLG